jgi:polyphenol oxidase
MIMLQKVVYVTDNMKTPNLDAHPELVHYFGDRSAPFGDVVGGRVDLGVDPAAIVWGRQVHDTGIFTADEVPPVRPVEGIDAVITDRPEIWVAVKTADCVPVLLYDPVKRAVAAIHSGRVCTEKNIVGAVIDRMIQRYGTNPADLVAGIGPAICPRCYEVDETSYQRFVEATGLVGEFRHPDMKAVIRRQLTERGVRSIDVIERCTLEDPKMCSYRRRKDDGRQISLIGMRRV